MDEVRSTLGEHYTTYKQYKADTNSVAGWLAQNALRCGLKISVPASTTPAPATRLKGKARKLAREVGTNEPCEINVSDFERLAKGTVDFKPRVMVP
jgi:hypothetical protein